MISKGVSSGVFLDIIVGIMPELLLIKQLQNCCPGIPTKNDHELRIEFPKVVFEFHETVPRDFLEIPSEINQTIIQNCCAISRETS